MIIGLSAKLHRRGAFNALLTKLILTNKAQIKFRENAHFFYSFFIIEIKSENFMDLWNFRHELVMFENQFPRTIKTFGVRGVVPVPASGRS